MLGYICMSDAQTLSLKMYDQGFGCQPWELLKNTSWNPIQINVVSLEVNIILKAQWICN